MNFFDVLYIVVSLLITVVMGVIFFRSWVKSGFYLPMYAHVLALIMLGAGITFAWMDYSVEGRVRLIYFFMTPALPAVVYFYFIFHGGADAAYEARGINLEGPVRRQYALNILGFYDGLIDGIWGVRSMEALRALQEEKGLTADADWNKETEEEIVRAIKKTGRKI